MAALFKGPLKDFRENTDTLVMPAETMNRKAGYMDVNSVSSMTSSSYIRAGSSYQTSMKDFSELSDAINGGDLNSAKSAFTQFQNDLKNTKGLNALLNSDTQVGKDFKALQDAFSSNDMDSVKSAMQKLQQDLSKVQGHKHHHHHHHDQDADSAEPKNAATGVTASPSQSGPAARSVDSLA